MLVKELAEAAGEKIAEWVIMLNGGQRVSNGTARVISVLFCLVVMSVGAGGGRP